MLALYAYLDVRLPRLSMACWGGRAGYARIAGSSSRGHCLVPPASMLFQPIADKGGCWTRLNLRHWRAKLSSLNVPTANCSLMDVYHFGPALQKTWPVSESV